MTVRITRAQRALTERWREVQVEAGGVTRLGISFRALQAEGLGLEPRAMASCPPERVIANYNGPRGPGRESGGRPGCTPFSGAQSTGCCDSRPATRGVSARASASSPGAGNVRNA